MATKRKIWTVKVKENARKAMAVLLVIFFVAFFLSTDFGSGLAAEVTGWDQNAIKMWAQDIYAVSFGLLVTYVGILAFSALPFVGIGLAVAGLVILGYQGLTMWRTRSGGE